MGQGSRQASIVLWIDFAIKRYGDAADCRWLMDLLACGRCWAVFGQLECEIVENIDSTQLNSARLDPNTERI